MRSELLPFGHLLGSMASWLRGRCRQTGQHLSSQHPSWHRGPNFPGMHNLVLMSYWQGRLGRHTYLTSIIYLQNACFRKSGRR